MSDGMMLASRTAWICFEVPAVMFEMVQHASFLIPFFTDESSDSRQGSAEQLITT